MVVVAKDKNRESCGQKLAHLLRDPFWDCLKFYLCSRIFSVPQFSLIFGKLDQIIPITLMSLTRGIMKGNQTSLTFDVKLSLAGASICTEI